MRRLELSAWTSNERNGTIYRRRVYFGFDPGGWVARITKRCLINKKYVASFDTPTLNNFSKSLEDFEKDLYDDDLYSLAIKVDSILIKNNIDIDKPFDFKINDE